MNATIVDIDRPRGSLIRWGAVIAGAVWGLGVMTVLATLWLALAFPSEAEFIRDNLEWFIAGSGAFSLFVAGLVAGLLAEERGVGSGWIHAMTAWATLLIASLLFGLPATFGLFNVGQIRTIDSTDLLGPTASDALWVTFLTLAIGAAAASLGGFIGGAMPRRTTARARAELGDRPTDDDRWEDEPADRHSRSAALEPETPANDRVMVRRSEDGTFVDQEGHRYVLEEPAGGPGRTNV
jgi:hypothetical protein